MLPESKATAVPSPPGSAEPKTWRCGTLVYTSSGLLALFACLFFGDFAWSMRERSVGPIAQWYLKQLGVSNLTFGLLVSSFPALLGLVFVPIVSTWSDRYRGRLGRRIPFLLVTTPIASLGMAGIALTPLFAKALHPAFHSLSETTIAVISFGIFWATFEFSTQAGQAVFGGLINDVVPTPLLGRFYGSFRAISLIDGIIFNYWIIGYVPTHFTILLLSISIFYAVAFTWACLKIKEGKYPPPPDVSQPRENWLYGSISSTRMYLRECFSQRYYLTVFLMLTLGAMTFLPVNAFAIPYAKSLGMDMGLYGKCLAVSFGASLCLAYPIGWAVDRFHPIRITLAVLGLYLIVALLGAFYATNAKMFAVVFVIHSIISGCYLTSAASLGLRLYPQHKFGQFASAAGALLALGTVGLSPLMGLLIDQTQGQFRYTFLVGAFLSALGVLVTAITYRRFRQFGGIHQYTAPEPKV